MQKLLNNVNTLIYSRHNKGKVVIAESFIRTLITYLTYLNVSVDQYNNTCHHLLTKNLLMLIILLMIKSELLSIKKILVKLTLKIGQGKYGWSCYENQS